ncbi:MAG: hypothetical protein P4L53_15265 [Candidatus Obscuribacterales bacterium]|nr:hypothetical protein [Candidatus Obscuribacterales bacterium]
MSDFDTQTNEVDDEDLLDERSDRRERVFGVLRVLARRFVMFLSFGPGVIGFLWLIGRILRR